MIKDINPRCKNIFLNIVLGVLLIFELYIPNSLDDALEFLAKYYPDAMPIAGGTELLILIRDKKIRPKYLVDLSPLRRQFSYIKLENGLVKIGALTTLWELSNSFLHNDVRYAGFQDVWHKFGTMSLRFMATIGGNIATATDFSDYLVLLLAYDAKVRVSGVNGERVVPLEEFIVERRKPDLKPGEIITEVFFTEPPLNTSSAFEKFDRRSILIAGLANSAVYLHVNNGRISDAKISLDMIKGKRIPGRLKVLEESLKDREFSIELIEKTIEDIIPKHVEKYTDWWTTAEYRLEMTKTSVKRALLRAAKRIGVV